MNDWINTVLDVDRSHAERARRRPGAGGKEELEPERFRLRFMGRLRDANQPAATAIGGCALRPWVFSCMINI